MGAVGVRHVVKGCGDVFFGEVLPEEGQEMSGVAGWLALLLASAASGDSRAEPRLCPT